MALVSVIESHDSQDEVVAGVDEEISQLQEHFFPPRQQKLHPYLSIQHKQELDDDEKAVEVANWHLTWATDPKNWTNAVGPLNRLERVVESLNVVNKQQLAMLLPMTMHVLDDHREENRARGLKIILSLLRVIPNREWIIAPRIHMLVNQSICTGLAFDPDIVQLSMETALGISDRLAELNASECELLPFLDALIERCFHVLMNKNSAELRVVIWRGLKGLAVREGMAFVRHYHWLFKCIDYASTEYRESALEWTAIVELLRCAKNICPERFLLRELQLERILERIHLQLALADNLSIVSE